MKWNRILLPLGALLVATLFGGLVTQEARAQTYRVDVDFVLPRSFLLGVDIVFAGRLNVLGPRAMDDTVTISVLSPDPAVEARIEAIFIPVTLQAPQVIEFVLDQATLVPGDFTLTVTSLLEGVLVSPRTYSVPTYEVAVGISTLTGEVGTQFLVTTSISIGAMSEVQTRFDIEYVLDGEGLRTSELVILLGDTVAIELEGLLLLLPVENPEHQTWHATQAFTLSPGNHTLTVNVVDQALAMSVFSRSFDITVTDRVEAIETRLDELSGGAERTSVAAGAVGYLSLAALALSVLALLLHFGVLKFGRFGRRGPGDGEE